MTSCSRSVHAHDVESRIRADDDDQKPPPTPTTPPDEPTPPPVKDPPPEPKPKGPYTVLARLTRGGGNWIERN